MQPEYFSNLSHGQPFCRHPLLLGSLVGSEKEGTAWRCGRPAPRTVRTGGGQLARNSRSGSAEMGGQIQPKRVVRLDRNAWSASPETAGQIEPKYAFQTDNLL